MGRVKADRRLASATSPHSTGAHPVDGAGLPTAGSVASLREIERQLTLDDSWISPMPSTYSAVVTATPAQEATG